MTLTLIPKPKPKPNPNPSPSPSPSPSPNLDELLRGERRAELLAAERVLPRLRDARLCRTWLGYGWG